MNYIYSVTKWWEYINESQGAKAVEFAFLLFLCFSVCHCAYVWYTHTGELKADNWQLGVIPDQLDTWLTFRLVIINVAAKYITHIVWEMFYAACSLKIEKDISYSVLEAKIE